MAVVTQISKAVPERDPAPPPRRTAQIVLIVDGRAALTLVESLPAAPRGESAG
jgi:hypothetical protein